MYKLPILANLYIYIIFFLQATPHQGSWSSGACLLQQSALDPGEWPGTARSDIHSGRGGCSNYTLCQQKPKQSAVVFALLVSGKPTGHTPHQSSSSHTPHQPSTSLTPYKPSRVCTVCGSEASHCILLPLLTGASQISLGIVCIVCVST